MALATTSGGWPDQSLCCPNLYSSCFVGTALLVKAVPWPGRGGRVLGSAFLLWPCHVAFQVTSTAPLPRWLRCRLRACAGHAGLPAAPLLGC